MNLQEFMQNKIIEATEGELANANRKLRKLNNSQELIDLVEDYFQDKFNIGYPIYLIGKSSRYMLYDGRVIDDNKARFLVSDYKSTRVVDIRNVYKYYEFSENARW